MSLQQRLEMMGLQSLHYYISENFFLAEDLPIVKEEIRVAQKEILDNYTDEDFRKIPCRNWINRDENDEIISEERKMELSHSNNILKRYLKDNRPVLYDELFQKAN